MPERINFLAVLVFDHGDGWVSLHPHTLTASHPEIAYQLALRAGKNPLGSKRLVGLSELTMIQGEGPRAAEMKLGDPADLVKEKSGLSAFQDPRWLGVSCDPNAVEEALSEPIIAFEPKDLEAVDWGRLSHAFGPAQDVPVFLRRLGAQDPQIRKKALYTLLMTILHQGSLYSATVAAIPFLLRFVSLRSYPDRVEVMDFVESIVSECDFGAYRQRREASSWERDELGGHVRDEPDLGAVILDVLRADLELLKGLQSDDDPEIRQVAEFVLTGIKDE